MSDNTSKRAGADAISGRAVRAIYSARASGSYDQSLLGDCLTTVRATPVDGGTLRRTVSEREYVVEKSLHIVRKGEPES